MLVISNRRREDYFVRSTDHRLLYRPLLDRRHRSAKRVCPATGLATPASAILSAVIFNALIIIALIPLALKGVAYKPQGAATLLRRNLLLYGVGGLIVPFAGIKLIDWLLVLVQLT